MITSPQNEKIKHIKLMQKTKDFYWWEGDKFFAEILKAHIMPEMIVLTKEFYNKNEKAVKSLGIKNVFVVSDAVFKSLSFTKSPQGIGGLNHVPQYCIKDFTKELKPCFYLAGVQDPGNVGTIIRVVDAFDLGGVIYEKRGAFPYNEKAVRSSAASILRVPCLLGDSETLKFMYEKGFFIFFLTPHRKEGKNIRDIESSILNRGVFVLGQEGKGIDFRLSEATNLYIPMAGKAESLNVAVTAGILAYILKGATS